MAKSKRSKSVLKNKQELRRLHKEFYRKQQEACNKRMEEILQKKIQDTGDLGLGDIVEEKDENGETKEVTNTPVSGPLINLQGDDKMELDEKKALEGKRKGYKHKNKRTHKKNRNWRKKWF